MTAWEKVEIARSNDRKTSLDYIEKIFDEFIELHGDRNFKDDKAIVCGLAKIGDQNYTVIAEQKGRSTKENIERIISLLEKFQIDIEKNRSILNKSYEEVYSKIRYLEENKMNIINNNNLHEIFFMSDLNMQIKYGISLDDLINKYINESIRGK